MYIRNRKQGRVLRYLAGITLATFLPTSVQAWEFLPSVTMVPVALEAPEPSPPMLAADRLDQLRQQLNTDKSPEAGLKLARLDDAPKVPEPRKGAPPESAENAADMLETNPEVTEGRVQLAAHTAAPGQASHATLPQPAGKQETEESERTFSDENRLVLAKMASEGEMRPDKRREAMQQVAQVRVIRKSQPAAEPAAPNGAPPVAGRARNTVG
ncbi:MAG: hypothetical protein HC888_13185 [Candidatus Competibacteraceae bacterium]|nr:hypothetical protein [Candidatus Competibacteraceae bacterium]